MLAGEVAYQTAPVGRLQLQRTGKSRLILDMTNPKHTPTIGQFTVTESLFSLLSIARHK
jgi:hypothetical protein